MARSRTIRRSRRKKKSFGFWPESFQIFAARRLVDLLALGFIAGGVFLLASLSSYDHGDPSWNSAGIMKTNIQNWGGEAGAWISDLLLQTLGIGGFAFALMALIWGARIFRREALSPFWLRSIALMIAATGFSIAFAQIPSHGWTVHPYLGSSAGTLLLERLGEAVALLSPSVTTTAIALTAGTIALISFLFAAAVTRDEIMGTAAAAWTIIASAGLFIFGSIMNFYNWVVHYNDPDYAPAPINIFNRLPQITIRRTPVMTAEDEDDETGEDDDEYEYEDDKEEEDAIEVPPLAARRTSGPSIPVVAPRVAKIRAQRKFTLNEGDWDLPPLSLLQNPPKEENGEQVNEGALRKNAELLQNVLSDFSIQGEITSIHPGPVVTLYELEPAPGIKTSRVISLSDDIARSMSAVSVRCAVVPGRNVIGIELPNKNRKTVFMQELLACDMYENTQAKLPLLLGKDIGGQPILADLAKMPHLLVAGTTGSGKSVAVNTMILSMLYRLPPEKCRFIMIDPKMLELSVYDDIPHLLCPVVTEAGKAVVALKWAVREMEDRYRAMSKLGVRNIEGYNTRVREAARKGETIMRNVQTGFDPSTGEATYEEQPMDLSELPYIVIVVDEFADLMLVAGKDVESAIQRLAQMARAAGLHLIMATQRPSVDVITGVIKANFPTRISFQVTSKIDSRTILGEGGAEQLLGMGDMLYMAPGGRVTRVHGPFVSDHDVKGVCEFLRAQGAPSYIDEVTEDSDFGDNEVMNAMFGDGSGGSSVDELYDQAVALVAREGKASTSFVQRYLQIGYNRAARIIEEMERQGVISKANAVGKREVLVRDFSDV